MRALTEAAAKHKRVTQMGNQIHSGSNYRRVVELVQGGAIGDVREVHVWAGAQYGNIGLSKADAPIPKDLDYDLWLGHWRIGRSARNMPRFIGDTFGSLEEALVGFLVSLRFGALGVGSQTPADHPFTGW